LELNERVQKKLEHFLPPLPWKSNYSRRHPTEQETLFRTSIIKHFFS
jgi:hypothetical protein